MSDWLRERWEYIAEHGEGTPMTDSFQFRCAMERCAAELGLALAAPPREALNDDDILCAVRSAAAETFGNDIVTAGGWPETKQRMALVDALVTKTCERLTESLAALSTPGPNEGASSPADARTELVQKEVGEGLRERFDYRGYATKALYLPQFEHTWLLEYYTAYLNNVTEVMREVVDAVLTGAALAAPAPKPAPAATCDCDPEYAHRCTKFCPERKR